MHVIILSETWIKSEDEAKRFQIPCYTHYYSFRRNKRGGGVSIFAHDNLKHHLIEEYCIDDANYLWIHFKKFSLDICAIYKPNTTNLNGFLEQYSQQLHNKKRAVVFGDFNLDLLNLDSATKNYKNILKENNFKILNKIDQKHCTRETSTSKTILDHVCSNLKENDFGLTIIESAMSDHKQLFLEIKRQVIPQIQKVQYTAIDYTKLNNYMKNTEKQLEESLYERLEEHILYCVSKCKVSKLKVLNPPRQDWINKYIISDIDERNKLWHRLKTNMTDIGLRNDFENVKTKVAKKINLTKSAYYQKLFTGTKTKPRKMWNLINDLCHNKVMDKTGPDKLIIGTTIITEAKEVCEHLNLYFATIGSSLANQIPDTYKQKKTKNQNLNCKNITLGEFTPTTIEEVTKIIDNLDSNTGCGIDGISAKTIKCIKSEIVNSLTVCINTCLNRGVFPDSLKIAKVIPIYKSGNKFDPYNYRPISVLPVISKIFERILYIRLQSHLNSIQFLYHKQYGFRSQANTLSATIDLITKIKNNIDKKQIAIGIFIDLKKAFDTVSHKLLLVKLSNIGINGIALKMIESYLQNRQQIVKIGKFQSNPKPVSYGIPQGSILGPLLFLIYINNISQIGLKGDISLYADDTSIFYFGHTAEVILPNIQKDLNLLNIWFQSNLLTINTTKTNYIIITAKNKITPNNIKLTINDQIIHSKAQEKFLGLIVDKYLTWKPHIE